MSYIKTGHNLPSCKPKYLLLINYRSSPHKKKLFPLSWQGERAYSKSRAPTEIGHQTINSNYWYHNQPTSLQDTSMFVVAWIVACKNRTKLLYRQAKVTLVVQAHIDDLYAWLVRSVWPPFQQVHLVHSSEWPGPRIHGGSASHRSIQTERTSHAYTLPIPADMVRIFTDHSPR